MMQLSEALPIIQALSDPAAKLHADHHICPLDHDPPYTCSLPPSAIYTKLDAINDTTAALRKRLSRDKTRLKPQP